MVGRARVELQITMRTYLLEVAVRRRLHDFPAGNRRAREGDFIHVFVRRKRCASD